MYKGRAQPQEWMLARYDMLENTLTGGGLNAREKARVEATIQKMRATLFGTGPEDQLLFDLDDAK